jgi:hypothetical protein
MPQVFASMYEVSSPWPVDVFETANWPTKTKLYQLATVAGAAYENAMSAAVTNQISKPIVVFAAPGARASAFAPESTRESTRWDVRIV